MNSSKVLILGVTGMLGHVLFLHLAKDKKMDVFGTARHDRLLSKWLDADLRSRVVSGVDAESFDSVRTAVDRIHPDVIINCIGVVKQVPEAQDPVSSIMLNALFPQQLARYCAGGGIRLVHFSTDCVFSGNTGNYSENDVPDADDLYGRTKLLGEVAYPHAVTLRTSLIGHELGKGHGLVAWFFDQKMTVKGYTRAIFSGFPTIEMARIISEFILPNRDLYGIYHVSAEAISKYNLLRLIAATYEMDISVEPSGEVVCNRSLNGDRFHEATGYTAPSWKEMVDSMCRHYRESPLYS